jgi:hypothetical protein
MKKEIQFKIIIEGASESSKKHKHPHHFTIKGKKLKKLFKKIRKKK